MLHPRDTREITRGGPVDRHRLSPAPRGSHRKHGRWIRGVTVPLARSKLVTPLAAPHRVSRIHGVRAPVAARAFRSSHIPGGMVWHRARSWKPVAVAFRHTRARSARARL